MCERLIVCDGFALAPTEIVGLFDHLQSQPRFFKKLPWKLRKEAFLGHIIGKEHASDKAGDLRDFEIAGKCYKSNDRRGDTRIIPWAPLDPERTPAGGRLLQSAREWLTSILGEISPSFRSDYPPNESGGSEPLLQCNINLYASADPVPMPLHRDDCSSQHTFYEAAVTCILYAKSLDGSAVVNDSSASAAEKFGLVLNKPGPTRDSSNAMGKLIGVFGDAYIKGTHMPGSGWDSKYPKSYERMSLNFRVVKKDAWSVLYESPRQAGEKTGADS